MTLLILEPHELCPAECQKQYVGQSVKLSLFNLLTYFTVCLRASYVLYKLGCCVGICLGVSMCLTALGLQQFSVGEANCSLCDFAMSGPLCMCVQKESE